MNFNVNLLGAVTVWYNPDPSFKKNILSYQDYVHQLIIVDNSSVSNEELFNTITKENKVYIWNNGNLGIASALNLGIELLIKNGSLFALTMDQDSFFGEDELEKLLTASKNIDWTNLGILSPIHVQQKSVPVYNKMIYTPALCVMTSGNILNLKIAEQIGYFKEELFIDHVDNEFCLRLNSKGFKVFTANSFLTHQLGKHKDAFILGQKSGGFISHSPERLYYFVRNAIYILRKYAFIDLGFTKQEIISLLKRFLKIFFEDQKIKRFKLYFKGIIDQAKL